MPSPSFYSSADITAIVAPDTLVDGLKTAMIAVSTGQAVTPPRFAAPINDKGRMGVMYGGLSDPAIHGAKFLSLYPGAPAMGLSSHQGFLLLFDSGTGSPLAAFDADTITAMRTAAVSMLATQTLARPDPKIITICGAGEQAHWHLNASLTCFPDAQIRVWARRAETSARLASSFKDQGDRITVSQDLKTAIAGADVIHTTTASRTAFLSGDLLEAGQHVNLIGASLADSREIDDRAVAKVTMFTDSLESSSRESGEIIDAKKAGNIPQDYSVTEIGNVLNQHSKGRTSPTQITAYKSHGLIVQDLIAAYETYQRS